MDSIEKAMDNLIKRRYLYALNFASTHGDNVIAPFIALTEVYDANIVFLDTVVILCIFVDVFLNWYG